MVVAQHSRLDREGRVEAHHEGERGERLGDEAQLGPEVVRHTDGVEADRPELIEPVGEGGPAKARVGDGGSETMLDSSIPP
jgi:hypothetical protein